MSKLNRQSKNENGNEKNEKRRTKWKRGIQDRLRFSREGCEATTSASASTPSSKRQRQKARAKQEKRRRERNNNDYEATIPEIDKSACKENFFND
jgi:hypothetical protein